MLRRSYLKGAVLALAALTMPLNAHALDRIKVAYMKIPPLASVIHGLQSGIFEKNGLAVSLTVVNSGPDLMTALASRTVDVGMTASAIVLIARAKGLPLKAIGTADVEKANDIRNWIVANSKEGIKSLKDIEGKVVGIVDKNGPADLMVRDHLMAAGVDPNSVKFVALPFPQLGPALEVGNVSAVHVTEPFHTQLMNSDKIDAVELAGGLTATLAEDGPISLGGWFAHDEWLADPKNKEIAARFLKSILQSNRELDADRSLVNAIFEKDFGMPPPVAERVPLPLNTGSLVAEPSMYQSQIKALVRTGIIAEEYPAEDAVEPIEYE
ncbi:ABC transporter substrate-binding protein [Rhizobium sp. L1K21]|uniref:ABC transporter substrate-binding protein n=1 Tax=Rhizobium sp. L1K21 TaxID=2954933 RepID=UPI0020921733|nr:ABC transporter substrate-binding protein [Rhizobium sp. L1K21]MCO6188408.1 ABC transporter substrate-binding protein [Rhizobium sp. L1K21]